MLLVFLGIFFVSCDEVERHDVLTFFFDGVPPLQQEMLRDGLIDSNSLGPDQVGQKPAWYTHPPTKDCSNCHSKRKQRSFTPQTYLIASIPKLCYNCHDDFTVSAKYVHGPVAIGQCIFCHNPHRSKIKHLLNVEEPGLCYLCHDIKTIELIAAHIPNQHSVCTDCHNPHTSSIKPLLRADSYQTKDVIGQPVTIEAAQQKNLQLPEEPTEPRDHKPEITTSAPVQKSESISEVFEETSRLIELGQLQQARTYLEKFKDNNSFTIEQRQQIARVLGMIDSAINNKKQQPETNEQYDNKAKEIADLYYNSMAFYRTGQLMLAREGFVEILNSGLIPESMTKTIQSYISDIDNSLSSKSPSKQ